MHEEHSHEHTHEHAHGHKHTHSHAPAGDDAARTIVLMKYMLEHNRQHASELGATGEKLYGDGREQAAALIAEAVHYFDHGNEKLQEAVKLLDGEG